MWYRDKGNRLIVQTSPDIGIRRSNIFNHLKNFIDETETIISGENMQNLIMSPYHDESRKLIREYNLSFGGYSHAYIELKPKPRPVKRPVNNVESWQPNSKIHRVGEAQLNPSQYMEVKR